jgi:hypothetical protein
MVGYVPTPQYACIYTSIIREKKSDFPMEARMNSAGLMCVVLLSLVAAEARRHKEIDRCMAVQQRLTELRAEIVQLEHEAKNACSVDGTPDSPHPPTPPLEEVAAGAASWAGRRALPITRSIPDKPSTTSGGRRRQTSGTPPLRLFVNLVRLQSIMRAALVGCHTHHHPPPPVVA